MREANLHGIYSPPPAAAFGASGLLREVASAHAHARLTHRRGSHTTRSGPFRHCSHLYFHHGQPSSSHHPEERHGMLLELAAPALPLCLFFLLAFQAGPQAMRTGACSTPSRADSWTFVTYRPKALPALHRIAELHVCWPLDIPLQSFGVPPGPPAVQQLLPESLSSPSPSSKDGVEILALRTLGLPPTIRVLDGLGAYCP